MFLLQFDACNIRIVFVPFEIKFIKYNPLQKTWLFFGIQTKAIHAILIYLTKFIKNWHSLTKLG